MLLKTELYQPTQTPQHPQNGRSTILHKGGESQLRSALDLGAELVGHYRIRSAAAQEEISVAVLGRRHFRRTISGRVYQNLSRLTTQWEESITGGLARIDRARKALVGRCV